MSSRSKLWEPMRSYLFFGSIDFFSTMGKIGINLLHFWVSSPSLIIMNLYHQTYFVFISTLFYKYSLFLFDQMTQWNVFFLIFDNLLIYLYKVEIQKFLWSRRRLQDSQYVSQYYMKSCFKLRFQKLIGLGKNPKKTVQIMIYAVLSPSILSAKSETRIGHLLPPILQSPKYSVMSALMAAWK